MKKIIIAQFIVLLAGTIFAWSNFTMELVTWLKVGTCTTGCAAGVANPFLTPCFYGAIFFTIAFILSAIILKKFRKV
ncbi:MAG TPA: hypothetical protein VMV66_03155 [Candidatus Humimicrobiaceae bacterium]|nr:hypothetical protein [Candidatus Humimicrobiaceae bacterium]